MRLLTSMHLLKNNQTLTMKKRILQIFGLVSFLMCLPACSGGTKEDKVALINSSEASNETPDELGDSFLMAVKNSDSKYIEAFLPSASDVNEIMNSYEGNEEEKKEIVDHSGKNTKEIQQNVLRSLAEIRAKGDKNGIEWKEVTFSTSELNTRKENNIEFAKLTIYFKAGTSLYKMIIPECIKSNRGWLIFDKPKWVGK